MAQYVHAGKTIDYTPTEDVSAESVIVLEELVCVANLDIAADTLGALTIEGVFDFTKASGDDTAISSGVKLYWDATNLQATTDESDGTNKYIGKSVAAATDDDTTVRIKLDQ